MLAGFVWAGLNEQANSTMSRCENPVETSSSNVRAGTNYYGAQIGMRGRREWRRWAVETTSHARTGSRRCRLPSPLTFAIETDRVKEFINRSVCTPRRPPGRPGHQTTARSPQTTWMPAHLTR